MSAQLVDQLIDDLRTGLPLPAKEALPQGMELDAPGSQGRTVLMVAAAFGFMVTAKALLDYGASVNAAGHVGVTALHEAASEWEGAPMVALLLDHGASIDARTEQGITPLMSAAAFGNTAVVSLLLQRGANPGATDPYGFTAADIAREKGQDEAADLVEAHSSRC